MPNDINEFWGVYGKNTGKSLCEVPLRGMKPEIYDEMVKLADFMTKTYTEQNRIMFLPKPFSFITSFKQNPTEYTKEVYTLCKATPKSKSIEPEIFLGEISIEDLTGFISGAASIITYTDFNPLPVGLNIIVKALQNKYPLVKFKDFKSVVYQRMFETQAGERIGYLWFVSALDSKKVASYSSVESFKAGQA